MSGRTLRASVREELKRAGHNCDMIGSHLIKIEELFKKGNRADLVEKFEPLGQLTMTLKELLISLRETL